ncbi:hypothetical protein [Streptomyces mangrovisoli]|uniref:hypothetical protein n=1 Tax=Streptomyces mangrovisoli TaxID=1428628 RepID=UPI000AB16FA9|nr:hypothetical protein [Streptomyces mangrovisoli]
MIKLLLRLILRDKPTAGPPSRGDILWGAAKDVLTGRDDASRFADRRCPNCRGSGFLDAFSGSYERCWCVGANVQRELTAYHLRTAVPAPPPGRPRVDLSGFDDEPASTGAGLTPAQQAQLEVESELWRRLSPAARQALGNGQLPQCCAHNPCICTVNHWMNQGGFASAPPLDAPQYAHWLQHRSWMLSHPVMNYTWGAEQFFGHPIPKDRP